MAVKDRNCLETYHAHKFAEEWDKSPRKSAEAKNKTENEFQHLTRELSHQFVVLFVNDGIKIDT